MGGFGAMSGMISSLKENNRLGKRKKTPKDHPIGGRTTNIGNPIQFESHFSQSEKDEFALALKKERLQSRLVIGLVLSVIFLGAASSVYWLIS